MKWNLAIAAKEDSLAHDAALDIITLNTLSGFHTEAVFQLHDINTSLLDRNQLKKFYEATSIFYKSMWDAHKNGKKGEQYFTSLVKSRIGYLSNSDSTDVNHLIEKVQLAYQTKRDSTLYLDEVIHRLSTDSNLDYNSRSILAYLIYNGYTQLKDEKKALIYLIRSAKYDIYAPVREHKPLYDLAARLYDMDDIDRAYRYIDIGMRDLFKTKVKIQMQYVEDLFPSILNAYNEKKETDNTRMRHLSICITVALVLTIFAYIMMFRAKRREHFAKSEVIKINEELNKTNERLNELNKMILKADTVKDNYIAHYLNMSLSYLNQMDKFRNMLLNVAHNKTKRDVIEILKSPTAINNELSVFYENFDEAFLHLFPNFVNEFNALLQPEARIEIGEDNRLNTELRVYALIRLGISDSARIAEFLRRSVSTIYNYRVKLRNSALSDRDDFDKQVQNIGRIS